MKYLFSIIILLIIITIAQAEIVEVIYLNDGTVLKGMIVEQIPGETITIETVDNKTVVIKFDDIKKIKKEKYESVETKKDKQNAKLEKERSIKFDEYNKKKKSKAVTLISACIPIGGTGHFYANEYVSGAIFLGIDIGLVAGFLVAGLGEKTETKYDTIFGMPIGPPKETKVPYVTTVGYVLIGSYLVARIIEYIDVYNADDRYNEKLHEELDLKTEFSMYRKQDKYNISNNYAGLSFKF